MPTTKVRPAQGAEEEGSQRGYGKNKAWACSLPREPQRDAICGNHTDPGHRAPILHSSDWQRVQAHPISSYGAAGQQWVGVWPDYGCHSSFCCKAWRAAADAQFCVTPAAHAQSRPAAREMSVAAPRELIPAPTQALKFCLRLLTLQYACRCPKLRLHEGGRPWLTPRNLGVFLG